MAAALLRAATSANAAVAGCRRGHAKSSGVRPDTRGVGHGDSLNLCCSVRSAMWLELVAAVAANHVAANDRPARG